MKCIFSGEETSNAEHIIPKWLQRKFNLFVKNLILPNGTSLLYGQAVIPVSQEHNTNFSRIENNISREVYNLDEIYLWALKLHLGLIYKDSTLKYERADSNSPFIIDVNDFESELRLFRYIYKIWLNRGSLNPSPLGTVYIIDSLYPDNEFDFIHCFYTGTIAINVGNKFFLVLLWDQRDARYCNAIEAWESHHIATIQSFKGTADYTTHICLAYRVWACELSYALFKNRRPFNIIATKNSLILAPPLNRSPALPENKEEFIIVARSFGLDVIYNESGGPHSYKPFNLNN